MNADLQDKKIMFCCLKRKNNKVMGMGGNLRISAKICVLLKSLAGGFLWLKKQLLYF